MTSLHVARRGDLAVPTFSPLDLSGLMAWYDASAITGLADGDPVASWADLSGNSRALAQGTAAAQPTYKTNVQNGRPSVRTDGVDDFLSYSAGSDWVTGTTLTALVVMRKRSSVANAGMLSVVANGVSADFNNVGSALMGYFGAGGDFPPQDYRGAAKSTAASAHGNTLARQTTHVFDGTNNTYYTDGTGASPVASTGSFAVRTLYVAARWDSSVTKFFGNSDYHEIVIYNTALGSTNRAAAEAYLKAKWATP